MTHEPAKEEDEAPLSFHLSLMARLRAYFFAGILITAPISITFYIAWIVIHFVDGQVAGLSPARYNPNTYLPSPFSRRVRTSFDGPAPYIVPKVTAFA